MKRLIFLIAVQLATHLYATLENPQVEFGSAEFSSTGAHTQVNVSDTAIINYDAFNLKQGESLHFEQSSEQAKVLNRVVGPIPSNINGQISALGKVYLVNPHGVFLGGHALIQTGDFLAAAAKMTSQDFLNGIHQFSEIQGPVVNQGKIASNNVSLIGKTLSNSGEIVANEGSVHLIRTDRNLLIKEDGSYRFFKTELDHEGSNDQPLALAGDSFGLGLYHSGHIQGKTIKLDADDGHTVVESTIHADSSDDTPSLIHVLGKEVDIKNANLSATGDKQGGIIKIGGGNPRKKEGLNVANNLYFSDKTEVHADAKEHGDGGDILFWSEENMTPRGHFSANGGLYSGNGGLIEVSSPKTILFNYKPKIDLLAPSGRMGTFIIDPTYDVDNDAIIDLQSYFSDLDGTTAQSYVILFSPTDPSSGDTKAVKVKGTNLQTSSSFQSFAEGIAVIGNHREISILIGSTEGADLIIGDPLYEFSYDLSDVASEQADYFSLSFAAGVTSVDNSGFPSTSGSEILVVDGSLNLTNSLGSEGTVNTHFLNFYSTLVMEQGATINVDMGEVESNINIDHHFILNAGSVLSNASTTYGITNIIGKTTGSNASGTYDVPLIKSDFQGGSGVVGGSDIEYSPRIEFGEVEGPLDVYLAATIDSSSGRLADNEKAQITFRYGASKIRNLFMSDVATLQVLADDFEQVGTFGIFTAENMGSSGDPSAERYLKTSFPSESTVELGSIVTGVHDTSIGYKTWDQSTISTDIDGSYTCDNGFYFDFRSNKASINQILTNESRQAIYYGSDRLTIGTIGGNGSMIKSPNPISSTQIPDLPFFSANPDIIYAPQVFYAAGAKNHLTIHSDFSYENATVAENSTYASFVFEDNFKSYGTFEMLSGGFVQFGRELWTGSRVTFNGDLILPSDMEVIMYVDQAIFGAGTNLNWLHYNASDTTFTTSHDLSFNGLVYDGSETDYSVSFISSTSSGVPYISLDLLGYSANALNTPTLNLTGVSFTSSDGPITFSDLTMDGSSLIIEPKDSQDLSMSLELTGNNTINTSSVGQIDIQNSLVEASGETLNFNLSMNDADSASCTVHGNMAISDLTLNGINRFKINGDSKDSSISTLKLTEVADFEVADMNLSVDYLETYLGTSGKAYTISNPAYSRLSIDSIYIEQQVDDVDSLTISSNHNISIPSSLTFKYDGSGSADNVMDVKIHGKTGGAKTVALGDVTDNHLKLELRDITLDSLQYIKAYSFDVADSSSVVASKTDTDAIDTDYGIQISDTLTSSSSGDLSITSSEINSPITIGSIDYSGSKLLIEADQSTITLGSYNNSDGTVSGSISSGIDIEVGPSKTVNVNVPIEGGTFTFNNFNEGANFRTSFAPDTLVLNNSKGSFSFSEQSYGAETKSIAFSDLKMTGSTFKTDLAASQDLSLSLDLTGNNTINTTSVGQLKIENSIVEADGDSIRFDLFMNDADSASCIVDGNMAISSLALYNINSFTINGDASLSNNLSSFSDGINLNEIQNFTVASGDLYSDNISTSLGTAERAYTISNPADSGLSINTFFINQQVNDVDSLTVSSDKDIALSEYVIHQFSGDGTIDNVMDVIIKGNSSNEVTLGGVSGNDLKLILEDITVDSLQTMQAYSLDIGKTSSIVAELTGTDDVVSSYGLQITDTLTGSYNGDLSITSLKSNAPLSIGSIDYTSGKTVSLQTDTSPLTLGVSTDGVSSGSISSDVNIQVESNAAVTMNASMDGGSFTVKDCPDGASFTGSFAPGVLEIENSSGTYSFSEAMAVSELIVTDSSFTAELANAQDVSLALSLSGEDNTINCQNFTSLTFTDVTAHNTTSSFGMNLNSVDGSSGIGSTSFAFQKVADTFNFLAMQTYGGVSFLTIPALSASTGLDYTGGGEINIEGVPSSYSSFPWKITADAATTVNYSGDGTLSINALDVYGDVSVAATSGIFDLTSYSLLDLSKPLEMTFYANGGSIAVQSIPEVDNQSLTLKGNLGDISLKGSSSFVNYIASNGSLNFDSASGSISLRKIEVANFNVSDLSDASELILHHTSTIDTYTSSSSENDFTINSLDELTIKGVTHPSGTLHLYGGSSLVIGDSSKTVSQTILTASGLDLGSSATDVYGAASIAALSFTGATGDQNFHKGIDGLESMSLDGSTITFNPAESASSYTIPKMIAKSSSTLTMNDLDLAITSYDATTSTSADVSLDIGTHSLQIAAFESGALGNLTVTSGGLDLNGAISGSSSSGDKLTISKSTGSVNVNEASTIGDLSINDSSIDLVIQGDVTVDSFDILGAVNLSNSSGGAFTANSTISTIDETSSNYPSDPNYTTSSLSVLLTSQGETASNIFTCADAINLDTLILDGEADLFSLNGAVSASTLLNLKNASGTFDFPGGLSSGSTLFQNLSSDLTISSSKASINLGDVTQESSSAQISLTTTDQDITAGSITLPDLIVNSGTGNISASGDVNISDSISLSSEGSVAFAGAFTSPTTSLSSISTAITEPVVFTFDGSEASLGDLTVFGKASIAYASGDLTLASIAQEDGSKSELDLQLGASSSLVIDDKVTIDTLSFTGDNAGATFTRAFQVTNLEFTNVSQSGQGPVYLFEFEYSSFNKLLLDEASVSLVMQKDTNELSIPTLSVLGSSSLLGQGGALAITSQIAGSGTPSLTIDGFKTGTISGLSGGFDTLAFANNTNHFTIANDSSVDVDTLSFSSSDGTYTFSNAISNLSALYLDNTALTLKAGSSALTLPSLFPSGQSELNFAQGDLTLSDVNYANVSSGDTLLINNGSNYLFLYGFTSGSSSISNLTLTSAGASIKASTGASLLTLDNCSETYHLDATMALDDITINSGSSSSLILLAKNGGTDITANNLSIQSQGALTLKTNPNTSFAFNQVTGDTESNLILYNNGNGITFNDSVSVAEMSLQGSNVAFNDSLTTSGLLLLEGYSGTLAAAGGFDVNSIETRDGVDSIDMEVSAGGITIGGIDASLENASFKASAGDINLNGSTSFGGSANLTFDLSDTSNLSIAGALNEKSIDVTGGSTITFGNGYSFDTTTVTNSSSDASIKIINTQSAASIGDLSFSGDLSIQSTGDSGDLTFNSVTDTSGASTLDISAGVNTVTLDNTLASNVPKVISLTDTSGKVEFQESTHAVIDTLSLTNSEDVNFQSGLSVTNLETASDTGSTIALNVGSGDLTVDVVHLGGNISASSEGDFTFNGFSGSGGSLALDSVSSGKVNITKSSGDALSLNLDYLEINNSLSASIDIPVSVTDLALKNINGAHTFTGALESSNSSILTSSSQTIPMVVGTDSNNITLGSLSIDGAVKVTSLLDSGEGGTIDITELTSTGGTLALEAGAGKSLSIGGDAINLDDLELSSGDLQVSSSTIFLTKDFVIDSDTTGSIVADSLTANTLQVNEGANFDLNVAQSLSITNTSDATTLATQGNITLGSESSYGAFTFPKGADLSSAASLSLSGEIQLDGGELKLPKTSIYQSDSPTLISHSSGDVISSVVFNDTVDGPGGLAIGEADTITFEQSFGESTLLDSLTVTKTNNTTNLYSTSINTSGPISWTGDINIGGHVFFSSQSGMTFTGNFDGSDSIGFLDSSFGYSSPITINGDIGSVTAPASVQFPIGGDVSIVGDITTHNLMQDGIFGTFTMVGDITTNGARNADGSDGVVRISTNGDINVKGAINASGSGLNFAGTKAASGGPISLHSYQGNIYVQDLTANGADVTDSSMVGGDGGNIEINTYGLTNEQDYLYGTKIATNNIIFNGNLSAVAGQGPLGGGLGGEIYINAIQRNNSLALASVYNNPDSTDALTMNCRRFIFGPNENLTSFGDLIINADQEVLIGDTTALGDIVITAPEIAIFLDPVGLILRKTSTLNDKVEPTEKFATTIAASGSIDLNGTIVNPKVIVQDLKQEGEDTSFLPLIAFDSTVTTIDGVTYNNPIIQHSVNIVKPLMYDGENVYFYAGLPPIKPGLIASASASLEGAIKREEQISFFGFYDPARSRARTSYLPRSTKINIAQIKKEFDEKGRLSMTRLMMSDDPIIQKSSPTLERLRKVFNEASTLEEKEEILRESKPEQFTFDQWEELVSER